MDTTSTQPGSGGGILACTLGWLVGSSALMAFFIWQAWPEHESELGAFHDPNAANAPIAGLFGWIVGGIGGACLALVVAKRDHVGPTVAILAAVTAVAAVPLALLTAVLAAFGGASVMIPIAAVYGLVVPSTARAAATARARRRLARLPPPP